MLGTHFFPAPVDVTEKRGGMVRQTQLCSWEKCYTKLKLSYPIDFCRALSTFSLKFENSWSLRHYRKGHYWQNIHPCADPRIYQH